MSELQKNKKASRGIVSRRKPKRNKDTAKAINKKGSDVRKFNLALPKDLFILVADTAASKNMKINAFIASALLSELKTPTITPVPVVPPKLNTLKVFLESMGNFDWVQALNQEEQEKKNDVNS